MSPKKRKSIRRVFLYSQNPRLIKKGMARLYRHVRYMYIYGAVYALAIIFPKENLVLFLEYKDIRKIIQLC